jgi:hypothetical protein
MNQYYLRYIATHMLLLKYRSYVNAWSTTMQSILKAVYCLGLLSISSEAFAASLNLTTIPSATQIADSTGGVWTVSSSGTCYRNGVEAAGWCRGVKTVLWYQNQIYIQVADGSWHQWAGASFVNVAGDPRPTPSASGATIPSSTQLVDSNYGVWTVDSNGLCYLNGLRAGGCSKVKTLLWYQGFMYVGATDGSWWLWNGSSWVSVAQDARPQPSLSGTTVPPATQIIDWGYGLWTVDSSGLCFRNGVNIGGCGHVKTLLWYQGNIYVGTTTGPWYELNGSSFVTVAGDPRPQPSASGTAIPSATQIVDSNYNVWTVDASRKCYVNGVQAHGTCSNVKTLLWYQGQIYVYNTFGQWYLWNGTQFTTIPATSAPVFNPAALGYSLKFNGTFGNPGDIDLANTGAPGFKWYPCKANLSDTHAPASDFSVDGSGVLTITAQATDNSGDQLCSATPLATAPYWTGNAFSGGWYVEYSIAFDNTTVDLSNGGAWPAVWSVPVTKFVPYGDRQLPPAGYGWPGQTPGYSHAVENDLFEYDTGWVDGWNATVHDWSGIYNTTCQPTFCNAALPFSNNAFHIPSVKWTSFNTLGQLWIPGTPANNYQGSTTNYFNGIKMPGGSTWKSQGVGTPSMLTNTPDPTTPGFDFSVMDSENFFITLGTGHTTPLKVQWVHVWQKP